MHNSQYCCILCLGQILVCCRPPALWKQYSKTASPLGPIKCCQLFWWHSFRFTTFDYFSNNLEMYIYFCPTWAVGNICHIYVTTVRKPRSRKMHCFKGARASPEPGCSVQEMHHWANNKVPSESECPSSKQVHVQLGSNTGFCCWTVSFRY